MRQLQEEAVNSQGVIYSLQRELEEVEERCEELQDNIRAHHLTRYLDSLP